MSSLAARAAELPTRPGDIWHLGDHRLACGSNADRALVERVMDGEKASLLFTSPPYANQRHYGTGGIADWDGLMEGAFAPARDVMAPAGQIIVNLGLVHRKGEWLPYWDGWIEWMRAQGWRRFGLYVWDQGPGMPGDWNGRLGPSFEFLFHFNVEARGANKITPNKFAGTANHGAGLRAHDGRVVGYSHIGRSVKPKRIPDSVIRMSRHKARGIEVEHPAIFPVALPEHLIRAYTDPGELVYEPFAGSATTIIAGERSGRRVAAVELEPKYVDLAVRRWRQTYPDAPVRRARAE